MLIFMIFSLCFLNTYYVLATWDRSMSKNRKRIPILEEIHMAKYVHNIKSRIKMHISTFNPRFFELQVLMII